MSEPASVLVVAHQTAATQRLLDAVRERAQRSPASFHLVVPRMPHGMHKVVDPQDAGADEAQKVLDDALPKLSEAAGSESFGSASSSTFWASSAPASCGSTTLCIPCGMRGTTRWKLAGER